MLMLKYCKTGACLLFFTLTAVGVFARSGSEKAKKAVFGGIELPSFTNASTEMHNYLMFSKSDMGICTKPVKLHFSANPDICHVDEPKEPYAPTCNQFALNVPTISKSVRERRQAAESQQNDLASSFVDDGKQIEKCRDGEFLKNTSLLLLYCLVRYTSELLLNDLDNDGIPNLFE